MFSLITKIWSESFDFALPLLLTHVVYMKPLSCVIVNGLRKTGYDADVTIGIGCYCSPNNVNYFYIYSNFALIYIIDMMQIFEND